MRGADHFQLPRAKALRKTSTRAEGLLWEQLRAKRFQGMKFVRQHPIGPYVVDFACRSLRLIIEVDGATHGTESELVHDAHRSAFLERLGYTILRISNDEVMNGMNEVLVLIAEAIGRLK
jgi:very-short-patch-repair endonuclease